MHEIVAKKKILLNSNDWAVNNNIQYLVLMASTVFSIYICYLMTLPFISVLVWALTLAVLFAPLQCWLELKFKQSSVAAIVSIFVIGFIVVAPMIMVGQQLVIKVVDGAQLIENKVNSGEWQKSLNTQPQLAPIIRNIEKHINLPGIVKSFTTWLGTTAGELVRGSVYQVIGLFLVFYVLFFFLRDRLLALTSISALSPLTKEETYNLFKSVEDTIHATIYGTFAIAAVQGTLGGVIFWYLGFSAPLLWGLVMSILAVIPMLGASIIWAPAALFLALEGNWGSALILFAFGLLIISTVDNLLRPILVGNRLKLHTVLAFLSVLGGIILFGTAGIVLGPIMLSITIALLKIWFSNNLGNKSNNSL
jgi:predicted PurR-regulated permease PerM